MRKLIGLSVVLLAGILLSGCATSAGVNAYGNVGAPHYGARVVDEGPVDESGLVADEGVRATPVAYGAPVRRNTRRVPLTEAQLSRYQRSKDPQCYGGREGYWITKRIPGGMRRIHMHCVYETDE